MALKVNYTSDKGIVSTYFRIANIEQNFINPIPTLRIYIYGYADQGFRETEKTLADKDVQSINYNNLFELPIDETKGGNRSDIYIRLITEVEMFKNATYI